LCIKPLLKTSSGCWHIAPSNFSPGFSKGRKPIGCGCKIILVDDTAAEDVMDSKLEIWPDYWTDTSHETRKANIYDGTYEINVALLKKYLYLEEAQVVKVKLGTEIATRTICSDGDVS
jgi:hypothetical protein